MSDIETGLAQLSRNDPVMARLIAQFPRYTPRAHDNHYYELASSIISQQLSVKAAASIERRFVELFNGVFPLPEQIADRSVEEFRTAGLSRAKATYIIDLAQHILDGRLKVELLPAMSNDEVIRELTAVKGIGEWTAHMFLMFSLGRLDILPVGDLGVRTGMQRLYELPGLPARTEMIAVAERNKWSPYESIASWYIWQSLDNAPE